MRRFGRLVAICVLCFSQSAFAQSAPDAASGLLKPEELRQLVAPIALYPDTLLSEVLMASTYPLEVVEADRWASANKDLKGAALKSATDQKSWDDSVKSLTVAPDVLSTMSNKLEWTRKLGDAVLAQQPDVMDAIQDLRGRAKAENKLNSTKEQKVSVKLGQNRQTIVIEPAEADTMYVPYYDPAVVYGSWPYTDYPPYYWPWPGYLPGAAIAAGVVFATGVAIGAWATRNNFWGGGFNWNSGSININRPVNINNTPANNWTHNPQHRQGVAYNNAKVREKFGSSDIRSGAQSRLDFRGRDGEQVLRPDRDRGSLDRASLSDRDRGDRPNARDGRPADRKANANVRNRAEGAGARNRAANARPPGSAASRGRENAFAGVSSGRISNAASMRGHASFSGGGGGMRQASMGGGGGARFSGGGGFRGGGGGRGRR